MQENGCCEAKGLGLLAVLPAAALFAMIGVGMGKKHHHGHGHGGCGRGGCAHCARCVGCARHHAEHDERHDHGAHDHDAHDHDAHDHEGRAEHGFAREFRSHAHGPGPARRRMDPLRILDKRYASGEIDEDDYLRRRQVLKDNF